MKRPNARTFQQPSHFLPEPVDTQVPWDEEQLNERRLDWLQSVPTTRFGARGDRQPGSPPRKHDRGSGWFWDRAAPRSRTTMIDELQRLGEISSVGVRVFEASGVDTSASFKSHIQGVGGLVADIPGDFAFDSWTCRESRSSARLRRPCRNRAVETVMTGDGMAAAIPSAAANGSYGQRKQWRHFTKKSHHPVRLPLIKTAVKFLLG